MQILIVFLKDIPVEPQTRTPRQLFFRKFFKRSLSCDQELNELNSEIHNLQLQLDSATLKNAIKNEKKDSQFKILNEAFNNRKRFIGILSIISYHN